MAKKLLDEQRPYTRYSKTKQKEMVILHNSTNKKNSLKICSNNCNRKIDLFSTFALTFDSLSLVCG